MIKLFKDKKYKRGFSMAEVVISLTVITIVTVAALMLVTSNTRAQAQSAATLSATNTVENAIECFEFAETVEEFEECFFDKVLGIAVPEKDGEAYKFENDGVSYKIVISETFSSVTVWASVLNDMEDPDGGYTFTK